MWDDINDLTFRWILYDHKTELRAINSQVTLTEFNSTIESAVGCSCIFPDSLGSESVCF